METNSVNESKEMMKDYLSRIQVIDANIQELKEARAAVLSDAKSNGIDKSKLNKAITNIRKKQETSPADLSEQEMYDILVQELDVIKSVKD